MDLTRVEELIELMRQSGVMQLSLELPDFKVSITRGPEGAEVVSAEEGEATEVTHLAEADPAPRAAQRVEYEPPASTGLPVVSPVVGVFHNGGMLDPRELINEGDRVREGQLLAAIEAMKVPNELRAPVSGEVTRLLVKDGTAVEYGQTLFVIQPDEGEGTDDELPIGIA
ncbi:MAG: biotin/lipoyl-binding protein [Armatimonadetes bacterium]|nr:biotin/lipoyl-binding protein [Armatimonadota bacterium]